MIDRSSNERYAISAESAACAMNGLDQPEGTSSKTPRTICGLQTRVQALIVAGYRPVPVKGKQLAYAGDTPQRDYAPEHFTDGTRIQIRAGLQKDGSYLYGYDLEGPSHGPAYDADREWEALETALPHVARKLARVRSTTGDGWWLIFRSHKTIHSGTLFQDGRKLGDFIGVGGTQRVPDFGENILQILTLTEIEHLHQFWTVRSADPNGESWTARSKQGASYAAGYKRIRATKADLCAFLISLGTKTSLRLEEKLRTAVKGERSNEAGNLMQCLMFNVHKLTKTTDFSTNCRTAMAYWMAAGSYGKADDKDYNQERDGFSLAAKIIHEDPILAGGSWTCPYWAKSHAPATPAPAPEPAHPRPAHRPVGDRAKHLATFRRVLEAIEPDDFGRRTYTLQYLADKMKAARCEAKTRTIQSYLRTLRGDDEIVTAQIDGNGRPYAVLTRYFGGADNYQKRVETAPKSPAIGGADQIAPERIVTLQTAETRQQCNKEEDHQNTCVPAPDGASYNPRFDATLGGTLLPWYDPTAMRVPEEWVDRQPPPRHVRRQARQKGQESFLGRGQDVKATYHRRKNHGTAPTPAPYRPRAQVVVEDLPDLAAAAAPAGARSVGVPLSVSVVERLHRLKADREAAHVS